jgi:electron transfer flavoprotein alpha subunit
VTAFWVVGETGPDGKLARISAEVATLARDLGEAAGADVVGVVVGGAPDGPARELARYLPQVLSVTEPAADGNAWAMIAAQRVAALADERKPNLILIGAGPDGRDVAGALSVLTGRGVLGNGTAVAWEDGGPKVEMSVFGGRLVTWSGFTGDGGIITVRPNTVTAQPSGSEGTVEAVNAAGELGQPLVPVVERLEEAGAAAPIEEARIIVAGGRGVGGEDGFKLVQEIADALGGAVGATRAAVDAGWINYSQQIGQTGKIVKPQLYLAIGISGAIQHKVGMQTADTIVAINRDPEAPIAEFADLVVVGDLFDVGPALVAELRARSG